MRSAKASASGTVLVDTNMIVSSVNIPPKPWLQRRDNQVEEIVSSFRARQLHHRPRRDRKVSARHSCLCMTLGWYRITRHRSSSVRCADHSRRLNQLDSSNSKEKLISLIATSLTSALRSQHGECCVRFFSKESSILVLDNLEMLWDVAMGF